MKTLKDIAKKDKNNLVTKKDGTLKARVLEAIENKVFSTKIYYQSWAGSNRNKSLCTYEFEITQLLKLAGYKFTYGNDAPRGGKDGDFIKISNTAFNFLKSLTAE